MVWHVRQVALRMHSVEANLLAAVSAAAASIISWATPRNGLALSRHQLTLSRVWREVMNKEGDVPEAVGMLCQSDLRLRL